MVTRSILRPVLRPVTRAVSDTIRGFNPRSLFSAGEQGIWLDPSDFSTLYQDAAGTTPVTALGQPVGKILDKSGRGNHASQTTSASRPTVEARVNRLVNTGFTGGGAAPTNYAQPIGTGTSAPSGTASNGGTIYTQSASAQRPLFASVASYSLEANTSQVVKMEITAASSLIASDVLRWTTQPAGASVSWPVCTANPSGGASGALTAGTLVMAISVGATAGSSQIFFGAGCLGNVSGSISFHSPQLEYGVTPTTYQRVNTATDYVDVGAPRYLQFDGTDDGMETPSINFTGTDKMTVWAGVRKLSDAALGMIVELSAASSSNVGAFSVRAPQTTGGGGDYGASSGGSIAGAGLIASGTVLSPNSSVITYTASIGTDTSIIRRNGAPVASSTADQGTGNYGNYPLYIGRRAGTSLPFNGRIYQLIIRGAASNAGQIAAGEAWCNSKARAY